MPPLDKTPNRIGGMFSSIASRYDRANHLLSFNQDKRWRSTLVKWAAPQSGQKVLDLCTGTGDLAIMFAQTANVHVSGIDISDQMLEVAREKSHHANLTTAIEYVEGNVLELPFEDSVFDIATIAFGLRNLPDYERGLAEINRVLKPGGQALILEFSLPKGLWGSLYLFYLRYILPIIGGLITGKRAPYQYLDESIRKFPGREDLTQLMKSIGFQDVAVKSFQGDIVLIHRAIKI
jgi:demethylmenaquinone methyltransferase/2-methoxy-6-polyprenyl-1,4-benzoquinol methylase